MYFQNLFTVFLYVVFVSFHNIIASSSVSTYQLNDGRRLPSFLSTWFEMANLIAMVPADEELMECAVRWAIDAGYRLIDTAFIYNTERGIGRAVRHKIGEGVINREDIFIISKLLNEAHARAAVVPALRKSLEALRLDYVDLYLIHLPIGQFVNRQIQQLSLLDYCCEKGVTVMGYTPFGSLSSARALPGAPGPRVDNPLLQQIATAHNKTKLDLGVIPIPKSVTKSRIEENIDVFDFDLSPAERIVLGN